jgi:hypothetical protein
MPRCSCAGTSTVLSAVENGGLTLVGQGTPGDPYALALTDLDVSADVATGGNVDFAAIPAGAVVDLNLDEDVTSVSLPASGHGFDVFIREGTVPHGVTWPTEIKWPGGVAPTLTTTPGHGDWISLRRVGTDWIGAVVGADIG